MGLNCKGPLILRYFSTANTTVLHNLRLVESSDTEEQQIQRNPGYRWVNYKLYVDFQPHRGLASLVPHVVQGSTVNGKNI